jgi:hypothetical protein
MEPPSSVDAQALASLRSKHVVNGDGSITAEWRSVLRTLASPERGVTVHLGSAERWATATYYSADGNCVRYATSGADHQIAFPCTAAGVIESLKEWLAWDRIPERDPVEAVFQLDELTAFAALVDAFREETLQALLARRMPDASRFTRDQVAHQIASAAQGDPRWLCGLLVRHAPQQFVPDLKRLNEGASTLAHRGWLDFKGDNAILKTPMPSICASLANLTPYASVSVNGPSGLQSAQLVMSAVQCCITLEFVINAAGLPSAQLKRIGGSELAGTMSDLLSVLPHTGADVQGWGVPLASSVPKPAAPAQKPAAQAPPVVAPAAVKPAMSAPAVAPPPARPAPQAEPVCPACGAKVVPGRPFCRACGQRV